MAMKFKGDVVHTEKYEDKDGKEAKKHTNVGALFEREDGTLCIKFLGSWLNVYPKKAKKEDFTNLKNDLADDSEIPF